MHGKTVAAMNPHFPLKGRHLPDMHAPELWPDEMRQGDYWKLVQPLPDGWEDHWCAAIPGGPVGRLPLHDVEEHEDGTITVRPGGFDGANSNSIPGRHFHGWIGRGVWAESEEQAKSLGRDTSAADVDGAVVQGHHESVGERQGRQPAPDEIEL